MKWDDSILAGVWLTAAILAGGFARTRNRSAWTWFLLTAVLGPIAAFFLVTWPPRPVSVPAATTVERAPHGERT